VRSDLN
jgi:dynein heavy chain